VVLRGVLRVMETMPKSLRLALEIE
jgi:hypothetical protein